MANYNIPQPERYINPNKVNTTKFIKIFSTDPRNNPQFLQENPFAVVIDSDFNDEIQPEDEFSYDIVPEPSDNNDSGDNEEDDDPVTGLLKPPTNLSIGNFELKISGDGTIYYTATLSFDDVDGAEYYEAKFEAIS